ncbi:unnamed protein product, partial [marine sediment metagenome]
NPLEAGIIDAPYIRSSYCEKIILTKTSSILAGAQFYGEDDKDLRMMLYDDEADFVGSCSFKPYDGEDSCDINPEPLLEGVYYICIEPNEEPTNYRLYAENTGETCGWPNFVPDEIPSEPSVEDYALIVKQANYAEASEIFVNKYNGNFSDIVSDANSFISKKYKWDCSEGCVIPILVSGIQQNINIFNGSVKYSDDGRDREVKNIFELT